MALTTYQSTVTITSQALKLEAYRRAVILLDHAPRFSVDVLRIQYMPGTQRIEIDVSNPLPAGQLDHLGLEGPI